MGSREDDSYWNDKYAEDDLCLECDTPLDQDGVCWYCYDAWDEDDEDLA